MMVLDIVLMVVMSQRIIAVNIDVCHLNSSAEMADVFQCLRDVIAIINVMITGKNKNLFIKILKNFNLIFLPVTKLVVFIQHVTRHNSNVRISAVFLLKNDAMALLIVSMEIAQMKLDVRRLIVLE